jgi:4-amino-4-deoxy-L-arabinose transferase-like glycosyltransferase
MRRPLLPLLAVAAIAALVTLPWLGAPGLGSSEGHRAIPAMEMAERGDWLVPTLFDTPYLRKPPGIFWAIRVSGETLGFNEWSARLVSAAATILGAITAAVFAARWFGPRHAWLAGATYALLPALLPYARAAEIEAINNAATLLAAALVIELTVSRTDRAVGRALAGGLLLGLALTLCLLAKGPASAPVIAGTVIGAALARRTPAVLIAPALLIGLTISAAAAIAISTAIARAVAAWEIPPVTQGPAAFAFQPGKLLAIAALPLVAFAAQLPASLALLPALVAPRDAGPRPAAVGRALAIAWIAAAIISTAWGISNPRYVLPAAGLACLCLPWAAMNRRFLLARLAVAGSPAALVALLAVIAGGLLAATHPRLERKSGRAPGIALADALCRDTDRLIELWADQLIEARPETLHYAEARARDAHGRELRARWAAWWDPIEGEPGPPRLPESDAACYVALRTDTDEFGTSELDRFRAAGLMHRLERAYDGAVYKFPFTVFRVLPE